MKTITYNTIKEIRTFVATLVILIALCGVSTGVNSGNQTTQGNNELSIQVKTWMGNCTYWNEESDSNVQDLANQMKLWISKSDFWSQETESAEPGLALQMKLWIYNSKYWCEETSTNQQELAAQIKHWMKNKSYLNESDEQLNVGNILANK